MKLPAVKLGMVLHIISKLLCLSVLFSEEARKSCVLRSKLQCFRYKNIKRGKFKKNCESVFKDLLNSEVGFDGV